MAKNITNRHGFHTGWYVNSNEQPRNLADIQLSAIRDGSRVGVIEVSPTPTPVFTDGDKLDRRHQVIVFNDASAFLYWSFKSNPVLGEETMPIPSGGMMKFQYDPNEPQDIYLLTSGLTTTVKIVELK